MMKVVYGDKLAGSGICIGKIQIESCKNQNTSSSPSECRIEAENDSIGLDYNAALNYLKHKLERELLDCPDEEQRDIIECQLMALEDEELSGVVSTALTKTQANAGSVVAAYTSYAYAIFGKSQQSLFAFRLEDLISLGQLIADLMQKGIPNTTSKEQTIVICDHVCLSHVLLQNNIVGIVERKHIISTHASLLLKAQGLPNLVGIQAEESWQGQTAILDANRGCLIINPTYQVIKCYQEELKTERFSGSCDLAIPPNTKILATINSIRDAFRLAEISDSSVNVGLVRTEMLFFDQNVTPSEDEQYRQYSHICSILPNRTLTFRTFDYGGDKYEVMPETWKKKGISSGYKGILASLEVEEDFKAQIRSLIRLSQQWRIRILFPYVTNITQVYRINAILDEIYQESEFAECVPIEKGFMIENLHGMEIADVIIENSDFVSVGTNDLLKSIVSSVDDLGKDTFSATSYSVLSGMIHKLVNTTHTNNKTLILCGDAILDRVNAPHLNLSDVDYVSLVVPLIEAQSRRNHS